MPEKVRWTARVEVQNGPAFSFINVVNSEAYAKIQVTVAAGGDGTPVSILPSAEVDAQFLMIKASKYVAPDDAEKKLTFTVGDNERDLEGPIILTDASVVGLLGDDLSQITFKNSMEEAVTVEVLVCRNAGPGE
jgi:hypothetical protein